MCQNKVYIGMIDALSLIIWLFSFMMATPVASYAKTSAKATVTVKKSSKKTVKTSTKTSVKKKVKKGLNLANATIYVGKTKTLKLTGVKGKVKWLTSNKKVATVSAKGIVKA